MSGKGCQKNINILFYRSSLHYYNYPLRLEWEESNQQQPPCNEIHCFPDFAVIHFTFVQFIGTYVK